VIIPDFTLSAPRVKAIIRRHDGFLGSFYKSAFSIQGYQRSEHWI
jgi:hypothetical protein